MDHWIHLRALTILDALASTGDALRTRSCRPTSAQCWGSALRLRTPPAVPSTPNVWMFVQLSEMSFYKTRKKATKSDFSVVVSCTPVMTLKYSTVSSSVSRRPS